MYRNSFLVALLFALGAFACGSSAQAVTLSLADYQDDFQTLTPANGWGYKTNSAGTMGTEANYTNLVWNSNISEYAVLSSTYPEPSQNNYARLGPNDGHPGPGTGNGVSFDHYTIAAYTIQASDLAHYLVTSPFQLTNTSINDGDRNGGNLDLRVYVNDTLIGSGITLPGNTSSITTFDRPLGNLSVGDTVYVTIGPAGDHSSDSFSAFDFTIQVNAIMPAPEPSTALLLGGGMLGLAMVRRRRKARQNRNA
jgi:hypothetical protein